MQKKPSKTIEKNYYRSNNQKNENDENIQLIKSYFETMCSLFQELQVHLISPHSKLQNLEQIYKNFLEEFKKIEDIMGKILFKYSQNSHNISSINNNKEKENSEKKIPNIKLFKNPSMQLYPKDGIKLDTIKIKNEKIREKIQEFFLYFDEKDNIQKRNKFLEAVANIAVSSDEFSYKLIDILLKQFNEKHKFNTIIYERAKETFSSWVNQRLGIETLEKIQFFEEHCSKEFNSNYIYNKYEKDKNLLQYYNQLFTYLCELFTIARLYSEKDIELKYFKKGEKYLQKEMKDITEFTKIRYVNFTILPGLCVNQRNFIFAKTLVFCEIDPNPKLQFNVKNPKENKINLNETIKTEELKNKLKIEFTYQKKEDKEVCYIFNIITNPDIPNNDNPLYLLRYYNSSYKKWEYIIKSMNQKIFRINRNNIPQNSAFAFDAQINGVEILSKYFKYTDEILNS